MAPKNKFTREEMVMAAMRVVQKHGSAALTARAVADELGVSTQPIFTCFKTMDELRKEVRDAAVELYRSYVAEGFNDRSTAFCFGRQYIRFAREERELYRMLFLTHDGGAIAAMESSEPIILKSLMEIYEMNEREADRLYRDMWLVLYSLGALIVTDSCPYSNEEIGRILTGFSLSISKGIKEIPGFVDYKVDLNNELGILNRRNQNGTN